MLCNSATANALQEVKELVGNQALVFDVINPVAEKVAFEIHQNVGVIATKATVNLVCTENLSEKTE